MATLCAGLGGGVGIAGYTLDAVDPVYRGGGAAAWNSPAPRIRPELYPAVAESRSFEAVPGGGGLAYVEPAAAYPVAAAPPAGEHWGDDPALQPEPMPDPAPRFEEAPVEQPAAVEEAGANEGEAVELATPIA